MKLKLSEAAKQLGVHPVTLRRWANEGKIKIAGKTPGGQRLFDLKEISEFVTSPTHRPLTLKQSKPTREHYAFLDVLGALTAPAT